MDISIDAINVREGTMRGGLYILCFLGMIIFYACLPQQGVASGVEEKIAWLELFPQCENGDRLLDGPTFESFELVFTEQLNASAGDISRYNRGYLWDILDCKEHVVFVTQGLLSPNDTFPPYALMFEREVFLSGHFGDFFMINLFDYHH